jgi:2-amino-4-hydroxy-6-hydroxymethyldihydropteridine diphosphokinase
MPNFAYLSLGSNIEPEKNLQAAVQRLARTGGTIRAASSVWETAPVGYIEQPNYLNAALILETDFSAEGLRGDVIEAIEQSLHRTRTENPNAPRTIDIDIILFNDEVFTFGKRQVPHPDILTRAFVAVPLAEIAPDYIHPLTGQTIGDIANQFDLDREGLVKREELDLLID